MRERSSRPCLLRRFAAAAATLLLAAPLPFASASPGGPRLVGGPNLGISGAPFIWDPAAMPIHYRVDPGPMAVNPSGTVVVDNAAGLSRVQSMFNTWSSVPTALLSLQYDGPLLASGTYTGGPVANGSNSLQNFNAVTGSCQNAQQSPVIFDPNGNLFAQLGLDSSVIGITSTCAVDPAGGHIRAAEILLNGEFIDGVFSGNNYELPSDLFNQTITHEIGHFLGLDHSQINVEVLNQQPLNCNADDVAGLPLMFPILFCQARVTSGLPALAPDDTAWISRLYPVTTSASGKTLTSSAYGTVQGTIYFTDGMTEAQGVNVIARQVGNPLRVAFSVVSGYLFTGNPGQTVTCQDPANPTPSTCTNLGSSLGSRDPSLIGTFEIPVTPGSYTIQLESINTSFTGGSSVGPLRPPIAMPGSAPAISTVSVSAGGTAIDGPTTPLEPPPSIVGRCHRHMSTRRIPRFLFLAALAGVLSLQTYSCGGGASTGPSPPPSPPPLTITTTSSSLLTAIVGKPYNQTLQATGGTGPDTWSLVNPSSPLPAGLSLSAAGVISGTPGPVNFSGAIFNFTVAVQDAASHTQTQQLFIAVATVLRITTSSLPDSNVGISYQASLFADGGLPAPVWSLAAGSAPLPAGLTLTTNGNILGTPSVFGLFSFTALVTDHSNPPETATGTISLNIANKLIITSTNFDFPLGVVSRPYSMTLKVVGGTTPYTWTLPSGGMPSGLSLSADGKISGTPTASGNFLLNLQVTDSSPLTQMATANLFFIVEPLPTIQNTNMRDGIVGSPYQGSIFVVGGIPPFTASLTGGALPDGLGIPTGTQQSIIYLPGDPSKPGTFNFTVQVADSSSPPLTVSQALSIRVVAPLVFPAVTLPNGLQGQAYQFTPQASGGVPPYTWSVLGFNALPPGIMIDSATGTISGIPTQAFRGMLELALVDSTNPPQQIFQLPNLTIAGILNVSTTSLPTLRTGATVNITLGVSGGIGPFAWSVSGNSLPAGLTLDPNTGLLGGIVMSDMSTSLTVHVNDAGPPAQTAGQPLTLTFKSVIGRNDSIATATPLSNGTYWASISPYADPPNGVGNPDSDYYKLTANPGAIVTAETMAQRLTPPSPLDTVIEILDSSGTRLTTCSPVYSTTGPFDQPCMDDDIQTGVVRDSKLTLQIPSGASGPQTFFVRVLDFRGDARPDLVYTLTVSGAN